jgi:sugar O-acyltransferase (sialic acid O-acetyltransferase NeuD family)
MNVYLLGAANPETIRVIRAIQRATPNVRFPGMLDNDPKKKNADFYGIPILGGLEMVEQLKGPDVGFVNLITGDTKVRHSTTAQIIESGGKLANLIHPTIDLTMTKLGVGLYLQESVILQAGVEVGDNCSIHMGAVIGHETTIEKSTFIAHAVSISGCCSIGEGSFIGTNATILPRIKIGRWTKIGAGSVVTKDVPDFAVMAGNPARVLRFIQGE